MLRRENRVTFVLQMHIVHSKNKWIYEPSSPPTWGEWYIGGYRLYRFALEVR